MRKKIALGDLGEFWYTDYKAPFTQLEGAVPGHPVGVILKDDDGDLVCAWCGKAYGHLGSHVKKTHGQSGKEYKEAVGLLAGSALVGEKTRQKMIAHGLRQLHRMPELWAAQVEGNARRQVRGPAPTTGRPERENKSGQCYAQIIAVAQQILREGGHLGQTSLRKRGVYRVAIERYFGSLAGLQDALGSKTHTHEYTDRELLLAIKRLAVSLSRVPHASDARRYGLPGIGAFISHFGSWNKALERAGYRPRVVVQDDDVDLSVLVAYSVHGSVNKTARGLGLGSVRVIRVLHRFGYPFAPGDLQTQAHREWAAEMAQRVGG